MTVIDATKVKNKPARSWLLDNASSPAYNIDPTQRNARMNTNHFFIKAGFIEILHEDMVGKCIKTGKKPV
mgnify:CR=1 FL=1